MTKTVTREKADSLIGTKATSSISNYVFLYSINQKYMTSTQKMS